VTSILEVVAPVFAFLEDEYGFVLGASAGDHVSYRKDPLSVEIWWGKGEVDVHFVVDLAFTETHTIFRPYLSRTFSLVQVALQMDARALEARRRGDRSSRAEYITTEEQARAQMLECAELMRRHCDALLRGDLTVLERLTMRRRVR